VVLEDVRLQPGILRHLLGPQAGADLELARGTVRELRLSIPWARILAQAQPVIQVTLRTVEVVVVRRKKRRQGDEDAEGGAPGGDGDVEQQGKPTDEPVAAAGGTGKGSEVSIAVGVNGRRTVSQTESIQPRTDSTTIIRFTHPRSRSRALAARHPLGRARRPQGGCSRWGRSWR
jgi:hypothetical protein